MRSLDKFRGCMLGGAAGDALGYEVEFMSERQIFERFGKNGITEFCLRNGVAQISDDTQMTMFTATGLLFGTTRSKTRGIMGTYESYIRLSYKDWYRTQTEQYPLPEEFHFSWLANLPEMFHRRAPGNTCMSALRSENEGTTGKPINNSKGCGGVMRVAPIGLYFCDRQLVPIKESDRIGAEAAAITHGHELGWLPAAALVHIIRRLSENEDETVLIAVQDSMAMLRQLYPKKEHLETLLGLMEKAVALSQNNCNDLDAIHKLGQGWVAEETLAIAVFCALKYSNDFEKALVASVNHVGDSDSTGAITGNILGTYLGLKGIPRKFLENLELRDVIQTLADDLFFDCPLTEYDFNDPVWEAKYIRMDYGEKGTI